MFSWERISVPNVDTVQKENGVSILQNAARKAGIKFSQPKQKVISLSNLRRNQRVDKSKAGKKAPRKFDLIPLSVQNKGEQDESNIEQRKRKKNGDLNSSDHNDNIEDVLLELEQDENSSDLKLTNVPDSDIDFIVDIQRLKRKHRINSKYKVKIHFIFFNV